MMMMMMMMMMKSRRIRWIGQVARIRDMRNAYNILFGRPRCEGEDNIRMDVRKIGLEGVDWMHLTHDRTNGGVL
jgi:hypothetical protein